MSQHGFRWFNIGKDGSLNSAAVDMIWPPNEELHAECLNAYGDRSIYHPDESTPKYECACGFWGFYNAEDALVLPHVGYFKVAKAFGVIEAWGEMVEHEFGFRAEYVVPRAIVVMRGYLHPAYSDIIRYRTVDAMLKTWDVGELKQVM